MGDHTGTSVQADLHVRNFAVDILHELDDKIDKFVLPHLFSMRVSDQEADVITLRNVRRSLKYAP